MAVHQSYTIRPPPGNERTDLKDALRIHLSPADMLFHDLHRGDVCHIRGSDGISKSALAFDNNNIKGSRVVQISRTLQTLYSLKLGADVSISASGAPAAVVTSVTLKEHTLKSGAEPISERCRSHWAWLLEDNLQQAEYLCPGMEFKVHARRQQRSFEIANVNEDAGPAVYRLASGLDVQVTIQAPSDSTNPPRERKPFKLPADRVAGLDEQLMQLNAALSAYDGVQTHPDFLGHNPELQGGIIIHGPSGTGKSLLLDLVSQLNWETVARLDTGCVTQSVGAKMVTEAFENARCRQPSLIIVEGLDEVSRKTINITNSLTNALDHVGGARTLMIATARNLGDVDEKLRDPGRFDFEIETTIPNGKSRSEILQLIHGLPKGTNSSTLGNIGERTHGYTGKDLRRLFRYAQRKAQSRFLVSAVREAKEMPNPNDKLSVTMADLEHALPLVRPTALREVTIETPNVKWIDIGGQHDVKRSLQEAVEWPLKYPDKMERYNVKPEKGVLLYGPPGCSKTLVAKALATEADLNFIAIKGAELMSMYVGESERAVREVFRKARAASPSILFFDEIDALGASRDTGHGGLHVLTTLLNELDGIEDLKGVFVLAATNNPQILDPALIRPGRFSTLFYVGLPDTAARMEILQIQLRNAVKAVDIDFTHLASVTEGFSGAEIVGICGRAGTAPLRDEVQSGTESRITMTHILDAVGSADKGVTPEQIARYVEWKKSRR